MDMNLSERADMLAKYGVETLEELKHLRWLESRDKKYCSLKQYIKCNLSSAKTFPTILSRASSIPQAVVDKMLYGSFSYFMLRDSVKPFKMLENTPDELKVEDSAKFCFKNSNHIMRENVSVDAAICPAFKI